MILRYGGENFFSFKEGFDINLRLNKNCPKEISKGQDVSTVMCIKGANAAGKTNALKALTLFFDFVNNSFSSKPEDSLDIESYFLNDKPTYLFVEFRLSGKDYLYEIEVEGKKVLSEAFYSIDEKGEIKGDVLFSRKENELVKYTDEYADLASIPKFRDNASLISIAHQFSIDSINFIYDKFKQYSSNVDYYGFKADHLSVGFVSKFYHDYPESLEFVVKMLKTFDTGIENIKMSFNENEKGEKDYYPVFEYSIGTKKKLTLYHNESSGTKRLYTHLGLYWVVLATRNIMLLDELDLHLHSMIIPELINLFEAPETNPHNSQLIFNCHNNEIMDQLGKYRIVLVDKENAESCTRRLDELPSDMLRNGRPVRAHYEKGHLGGIPEIKNG